MLLRIRRPGVRVPSSAPKCRFLKRGRNFCLRAGQKGAAEGTRKARRAAGRRVKTLLRSVFRAGESWLPAHQENRVVSPENGGRRGFLLLFSLARGCLSVICPLRNANLIFIRCTKGSAPAPKTANCRQRGHPLHGILLPQLCPAIQAGVSAVAVPNAQYGEHSHEKNSQRPSAGSDWELRVFFVLLGGSAPGRHGAGTCGWPRRTGGSARAACGR